MTLALVVGKTALYPAWATVVSETASGNSLPSLGVAVTPEVTPLTGLGSEAVTSVIHDHGNPTSSEVLWRQAGYQLDLQLIAPGDYRLSLTALAHQFSQELG